MQNALERLIACLLLPVILPVLAILWLVVVGLQGRPFLYRSERMRDARTSFRLLKIRTMHPALPDASENALGGHERARVTRIGAFLRRSRLDELPQIFNVIRGDIGFVGPRPPLRRHFEARAEVYGRLLARSRPGITGLATVMVHAREERLLSVCGTPEETEEVYLRRCLPVKLRLDRLYAERRSPLLDALILWRTFARLPGQRKVRSDAGEFIRLDASDCDAALAPRGHVSLAV